MNTHSHSPTSPTLVSFVKSIIEPLNSASYTLLFLFLNPLPQFCGLIDYFQFCCCVFLFNVDQSCFFKPILRVACLFSVLFCVIKYARSWVRESNRLVVEFCQTICFFWISCFSEWFECWVSCFTVEVLLFEWFLVVLLKFCCSWSLSFSEFALFVLLSLTESIAELFSSLVFAWFCLVFMPSWLEGFDVLISNSCLRTE